jgi:hypothetical protein
MVCCVFKDTENASYPLVLGKQVIGEGVPIKAAKASCMAYPEELAGIEVEAQYFGGREAVSGGVFDDLVAYRCIGTCGMLGISLQAAQGYQ